MTTFDVYSRLSSGEVELLATIRDGTISGHGRKGVLRVFKVTGIDPSDEYALSNMVPGSYFEIKPRVKEAQTTLQQLDHRGLSRILEHLPGQHDQKEHGNWAKGQKWYAMPIGKGLTGSTVLTRVTDRAQRKKLRRQRRKLERKSFLTFEQQAKLDKLNKQLGPRRGTKVVPSKSVSPVGRSYNDQELAMMSDPMADSGLRPQPGINGSSYIAQMQNGEKAYVKQMRHSYRDNIDKKEKGDLELNEALADLTTYELDQQLGYDIVPPVALRDDLLGGNNFSNRGHVIASEWAKSADVLANMDAQYKISHQEHKDFENMMVLDIIIGNVDRYDQQILSYHDGLRPRLAAIDHGLSLFPNNHADMSGWIVPAEQFVRGYLARDTRSFGKWVNELSLTNFNLDVSKGGPWQQAVNQKHAILKTISRSMSQGGTPTRQVTRMVRAARLRIEAVEDMLDNGTLQP